MLLFCDVEMRAEYVCVLQMSSSSDDSDSDSPVSPLRPVRPRHTFPAAPSQKENPPSEEPLRPLDSCRESNREDPTPCVFQRDEYHSAIRSLGSAKTLRQAPSQPQFSSTPAVSSSNKSALVPEDEYLADDWLDDDLGEMQPKKKRRLRMEHNEPRREETASSSTARSQNHHSSSETSCRGRSLDSIWIFDLHSSPRVTFLRLSPSRLCAELLQQGALSEEERLT